MVAHEKLWYLQRINIFADMTEAEMRRLAERTTMHRYTRGEVIARPDDPPERLAEAYGEPHADGRRLMLRFTHQDLASMIGATRETVTNVLIRFRDEGLIAVEEHHIVVRDLHRLATREP